MKQISLNVMILAVITGGSLGLSTKSVAQDLSLHVDFTGSSFDAKSNQVKGVARQNGAQVTADRLTFDLRTLHTGVALRDKHLLKALDADKTPEAVLANVVGSGGKFKGDLTLHGATKKGIEGEYTIQGQKVNAHFKTNISDYKMEPPTYMGGSIQVEDEVEIHASVPLAAAAIAPAKPKR